MVPPWSCETVMPMAHTAAMHMTWERGRPARIASPRARCPHSQPMFTSAVHAAPPHNAVMNIRLFLGGLRPPKPSQGPGPGCAGLRPASAEVWGNRVSPSPCGAGGWGNPVSPPPSPRAYVHVSRPCGSAAPRRDENRLFLGGRSPHKPSQGPGPGCAGLRPASAEVWGNRVSPSPSSEGLCSR